VDAGFLSLPMVMQTMSFACMHEVVVSVYSREVRGGTFPPKILDLSPKGVSDLVIAVQHCMV